MTLNAPMISIELEHLFGVGAHRRMTGQAVSHLKGFLAAFFVYGVAFQKYFEFKKRVHGN